MKLISLVPSPLIYSAMAWRIQGLVDTTLHYTTGITRPYADIRKGSADENENVFHLCTEKSYITSRPQNLF